MEASAWSRKGRAFEYACDFSVDEAIIPAVFHRRAGVVYFVVEVRTNFYLKSPREEKRWFFYAKSEREEEKRWLGSERFRAVLPTEEWMRKALAMRLRDYWMSPPQIKELLDAATLFAGAAGERPTVLHLEVCTVQEKGEALDAGLARGMRPDTLRPLDLVGFFKDPNPKPGELFNVQGCPRTGPDNQDIDFEAIVHNAQMVEFLGGTLYEGVRVDDATKGLAVMHQCGICGGKPFVGTIIAKLRCGHLFHYHCVVWPLRDGRACPIPSCRHPPYNFLKWSRLPHPLLPPPTLQPS